MTSQQFAALENKIQTWMDALADEDTQNLVVGNRTVELMAAAARSVFDACEESQEYAQREGLLKTT